MALTETLLVATLGHQARSKVTLLDLSNSSHVDLDLPFVDISYDAMRRISDTSFAIIGSTAVCPNALYIVMLRPNGCEISLCATSFDMARLPSGILSRPEAISFIRPSKSAEDIDSHGFFMAPTNVNYQGCSSTLPPCIVFAHGGPTKHVRPSVNLDLQFLTSRGYAVAILNYSGSTGYGRAYRDRLNGRWGVEDVEDAKSCVNYLAEKGWIDKDRIGIMGGSAGGYLTLQALCATPGLWAS